ncbi:hypothetical protein JYT53_00715 [Cytophagaceae bacterium AH-315-L13]|nr:hypothetical protein [Cytophagaceae bacterium AH-315-L13]
MKVTTKFLVAVLAILILTSGTSIEKDFHVKIEQDGQIIEPINNKIILKRKEFSIVFEFSEPMGLLINGSFVKKTYKLASKNKPKTRLPGFQNTGMAEGLLNPDKEIFVSNDSPNYWFYDDNEKNRFNEIITIGDKIICKRIIQNLYDIGTKTNIKVEDVDKPLYLVFISYKRGDKVTDQIEIKREFVKIKWIK